MVVVVGGCVVFQKTQKNVQQLNLYFGLGGNQKLSLREIST
jgi:hypothetical protein